MSNKTDVKLTFAEITALPRGDRYTLFQTNVVKPFGAVAKAKEAVDEKMHNAMKLTASLKREYAAMLFAREIPPDMTEGKFFTQYCGGTFPPVKGLATFFNAVVLTGPEPLIPEEHIDAASVTSLEKAASIIPNPPCPPCNPAPKAGFFCQSTLTINTMKKRNTTTNRPITTTSITTEMLAQVAREIPEPDAGFRDERARRHFQHRRDRRFATLQTGIQWFLDTHCEDDVERQMAIAEYRKQSATFAALHQARN